ncbi:MAG: hypothetical protein BWY77_00332 [bacterium ADurb.Bin431]|nr:MAG: hypothetical protein BWY77_00332 [bacterium ADurb.Bin431]
MLVDLAAEIEELADRRRGVEIVVHLGQEAPTIGLDQVGSCIRSRCRRFCGLTPLFSPPPDGGEGTRQPLQPLRRRTDRRVAEIDRRAVVALQNEKAHLLAAELAERFFDRGEIAEGLGHLDPVDQHHVVVQPVLDEAFTGRRLALGNLAFVVRKLVLHAAAVDVEALAEIFHRHRRALDVPAGKTPAPGAVPLHDVLRFGLLPQREIGRVALLLHHFEPRPRHLLLHLAPGELAVLREFADVEIDRAIDLIGHPLLEQFLHQLDLFGHMAAGARRYIRPQHIEGIHGGEIGARIALDQLHRLQLFAFGAAQDAVLAAVEQVADVGDVLHIAHLVADEPEIADDHVERDVALDVADMGIVIDRRAANVHGNPAGGERLEELFTAAETVINR